MIISGTAAVANLAMLEPRLLAAVAAIIGAMQLVFDFGGRARIHEMLQRKYFELIAEIDAAAEPTEEQIRQWQAALYRIYLDEPPCVRWTQSLITPLFVAPARVSGGACVFTIGCLVRFTRFRTRTLRQTSGISDLEIILGPTLTALFSAGGLLSLQLLEGSFKLSYRDKEEAAN